MHFAFTLFKFFPYGGISRDLVKFAGALVDRGHDVRVYAIEWSADWRDSLPGVEAVVVPVRGIASHRRYARFADWVANHLETNPVDLVVGMNKMPGLDVYYAGDSCYEEKARTQRPWYYRLLPRYRYFSSFEQAVFGDDKATKILTISPTQPASFKHYYATPEHRFFELPPGIERDRAAIGDAASVREHFRREFGFSDDELAVLFVGSGFIKKGLDRLLIAVAALPAPLRDRTRLLIVGEDKTKRFRSQANRLGIANRVEFLGGRDDVPRFLAGCDAFVLPAYDEAAGMVIIEAIIGGLPTLVTANCGYASHVARAGAGLVSPMPFDQQTFNGELEQILTSAERQAWSTAGRRYGADEEIYSMVAVATELFEKFASGEVRANVAMCALRFDPASGLGKTIAVLAERCTRAGLHVQLYTLDATGPTPLGIEVVPVPVASVTHYKRYQRYAQWVRRALQRRGTHCVVAFDPIPDSDIIFVRDVSVVDKARRLMGQLYRSGPAHRTYADVETAAVRGAGAATGVATGVGAKGAGATGEGGTRVIVTHDGAAQSIARVHAIARDQVDVVEPIVDVTGVRDGADERTGFGIAESATVIGIIGSDLARSGLDRLLRSVAAIPAELRGGVEVLAAGELPDWAPAMVDGLGLSEVFHHRPKDADVSGFYRTVDVLVLPAYDGVLGTALIEAMACATGSVTLSSVPYASFVADARAGIVQEAPFEQMAFNDVLADALRGRAFESWDASEYVRRQPWGSGSTSAHVVDLIHARIAEHGTPPTELGAAPADVADHAGSV